MTDRAANGHRRTKNREKAADVPGQTDIAASYAELQRELAAGLVALRAEFREAISNYSVSVQGLMAQASDTISESSGPVEPGERIHRARALRDLLDELDQIDLKPNRGRRKDLKRVEKFVSRLTETVAGW